MAEGLCRKIHGDSYISLSAGVNPHGINPSAIKVMNEIGIDISKQKSQHIDEFKDSQIDYIITVCDNANASCPTTPCNCKIIHHQFDDPPKMEKEFSDPESKLDCYRAVRDQIKTFIETIPTLLAK
jgi:arsenate reductase